jgi:hypothetical protein
MINCNSKKNLSHDSKSEEIIASPNLKRYGVCKRVKRGLVIYYYFLETPTRFYKADNPISFKLKLIILAIKFKSEGVIIWIGSYLKLMRGINH